MNQLDSLKQFSKISADTGDINEICCYHIQNATTNPSLILKSPLSTTYFTLLEDSLIYARKKGGNQYTKTINASDRLIVNIGAKILDNISGYVSTEIDARLSLNSDLTIEKAHKLIQMYHEKNINTSRVLIKIASTWEGIKAAKELQRSGIKCNLTLIFSFAQARACAEHKVHLISPFVGRIYDWYFQHNLLSQNNINDDPGIKALKKIFYYYKQHNYHTIIMGASFRTIKQILAVSGCDYLTIAPKLLKQLFDNKNSVECCLFPSTNKVLNKPTPLSKETFFLEHNQDKMAIDKLTEGIHQFSLDQQNLHNLLIKQL